MAGRIDTHFHMIPPFWAKALEEKVGKPSWGTPDWSLQEAISMMDKLGTEVGIISLATPSVSVWKGAEQRKMARKVNDFGTELRVKSDGRLGYFATISMPDPEAAVADIASAYDDYDADGVIMLTSYEGAYLGDKKFEPVWEELEKRKAVVFLHPGIPKIEPLKSVPQPTFDFPMDSTRSAIELVTSGVLKKHPSVRIILSHAGGFLPYSVTRFAVLLHSYTMKDTAQDDIESQLKNFYFDTALSTPDALPSLLAVVDPSRIIFGSDNPYIDSKTQEMFTVNLDQYEDLPEGLLPAINRTNAEALFPRLKRG